MIISTVISLGILVLLVWFVMYPAPVKLILDRVFPTVEYKANANAQQRPRFTRWANTPSKRDALVVIFIGGAGLFSKVNTIYGFANMLNEQIGATHDIVTFNYPVRFKNTVYDAMLDINETLTQFLREYGNLYKHFHAVGISFGALLAGAFYNKEDSIAKSREMKVKRLGLKFESFVGINGLFDANFNVKIFDKLFKYYIMKGTPALHNYNCDDMVIPKFVISSKSDFLLTQSIGFIRRSRTSNLQFHIYDKSIPHTFPQLTHLEEARDCIKRVAAFIVSNSAIK